MGAVGEGGEVGEVLGGLGRGGGQDAARTEVFGVDGAQGGGEGGVRGEDG